MPAPPSPERWGPAGLSALQTGIALAGLTAEELWTHYVTFGGALGFKELRRILAGIRPMPASEYEILADTVNDQLVGLGINYRVT